MADSPRTGAAWAWLALGVGLSLLPLWAHPLALAGTWLAQPALALGLAGLRGRRPVTLGAASRGDALALAAVWAAALALVALAVGWPLAALRDTGSLAASLALSGMAGAALLCLWRGWPAFGLAERESARLPALASAVGSAGPDEAGRGFVVALSVFVVAVGALLLAWPGLVPAGLRLPLVAAQLFTALVAHALVQRYGAPPPALPLGALPIYGDDDDEEAAVAPAAMDDEEPDSALYAATRAGRIDAALAALQSGADPSAEPPAGERDQRTLPMLAALLGDLRLLRELIARGVDLNAEHAGLTPLLAATRDSWHGRPEAVMTLLANGADARRADADGNTPLHHAARSTDAAVAALLLDAGALLDALNQDGFSPLGVACAAGNWRLARFLIERGAKPEPKQGQPALLAAVVGDDDIAGVQLLLRHKARVDARGIGQRTALLLACAAGNAEIVGELLDAGADRNARDGDGASPLLEAARGGHAGVLARLALAKPDAAAVDERGRNALVLAAETGVAPELLRHLIAMGVNPEQRDQDGRRALEHALGAGRWPLVAVLDPTYPLPASVAEGLSEGHFEKTPRELLREALSADRPESAEAMLRLGAGPDAVGLASLLLEFAGEGDLPNLSWLLRHGASADVRLDDEDSVFFHLLGRGGHASAALLRLLDGGQAAGGRGGLARWLQACLQGEHTTRGHEQFALALLERGADAFGGAPPDPPQGLAIRQGWLRLAEPLQAAGADPNGRR
ncbi:MAG: ankyrin repeat domain-containing protein, partial [Arenimonas sp.]|uniref:ankyrin repeat domain-containing protein n=1 Tax=Arenimonas sp. TaxID=1872635 RepID=UPI0025B860BD